MKILGSKTGAVNTFSAAVSLLRNRCIKTAFYPAHPIFRLWFAPTFLRRFATECDHLIDIPWPICESYLTQSVSYKDTEYISLKLCTYSCITTWYRARLSEGCNSPRKTLGSLCSPFFLYLFRSFRPLLWPASYVWRPRRSGSKMPFIMTMSLSGVELLHKLTRQQFAGSWPILRSGHKDQY